MTRDELKRWINDHPSVNRVYELVQCGLIQQTDRVPLNYLDGRELIKLDDGPVILVPPARDRHTNKHLWWVMEDMPEGRVHHLTEEAKFTAGLFCRVYDRTKSTEDRQQRDKARAKLHKILALVGLWKSAEK